MGVVCLDDKLDTGPCGIRNASWAGAGGGVARLQEVRVQVLKAQLPAVLAPFRPVALRRGSGSCQIPEAGWALGGA